MYEDTIQADHRALQLAWSQAVQDKRDLLASSSLISLLIRMHPRNGGLWTKLRR